MEIKYKIPVKYDVRMTEEDMECLIIDAFESGIGYLSILDNTGSLFTEAPEDETVSETAARILMNGGALTLIDSEDPEEVFTLTLDSILKGIRIYVEGGFDKYHVFGPETDMANSDATVVDEVIQFGLFGDLVYG